MTVAIRGRCNVCGMRFIACSEETYNNLVHHHIVDRHRDQPPDKPLVERL